MNSSLIAVRYAKALFSLANEQTKIERVNKDILLLQSYCEEEDGFTTLLSSAIIKPDQKKKMIHSVLEGHLDVITMNLLNLLLDNKREGLLEDINRHFISLYKKQLGIKDVVIYSVIRLEPDYLETIQKYLEAQFKFTVLLTVKVKPDLLGGFILTVDDKIIDLSLNTKLKQLKKELLS